ncbi:MAG: hypothetical protein ACFB12_22935 [Leptolyngbyaceae cyanobacterium]
MGELSPEGAAADGQDGDQQATRSGGDSVAQVLKAMRPLEEVAQY